MSSNNRRSWGVQPVLVRGGEIVVVVRPCSSAETAAGVASDGLGGLGQDDGVAPPVDTLRFVIQRLVASSIRSLPVGVVGRFDVVEDGRADLVPRG